MPRRRPRILAVLADHPGGLAAENLLARLRPGATLLERRRMLRALRGLEAAGLVSVSGKKRQTEIATALIALRAPAHNQFLAGGNARSALH